MEKNAVEEADEAGPSGACPAEESERRSPSSCDSLQKEKESGALEAEDSSAFLRDEEKKTSEESQEANDLGEEPGSVPSPSSPVTSSTCVEATGDDASSSVLTAKEKRESSAEGEDSTEAQGGATGAVSSSSSSATPEGTGPPTWPGFEPDEGWEAEDNIEGRAEQLRHFFSPLSREQLLDLLSVAALRDRSVYELCAERVHSSPSSRRLMVRNIHFNTSDQRFYAFFESFGPLDDALIVKERSGSSKGYGFVTFSTSDGVKNCLLASPLFLDGRQLHVKLAADPFVSRDQTKLFVRNLSDQTTTDSLRAVFSQFGHLKECVVVRDSSGRSRGYGFLNFATPLEAFKAVQQTERIIDGRVAFIHFAASTTSRNNASNRSAHHSHASSGGAAATGIANGVLPPSHLLPPPHSHVHSHPHPHSQVQTPDGLAGPPACAAAHRSSAPAGGPNAPPHRAILSGCATAPVGGAAGVTPVPGLAGPGVPPRVWGGGGCADASRFPPKRRGNNPNARLDGSVVGPGGVGGGAGGNGPGGLRGGGAGGGGSAKGYRNLDRLVYGDAMGYGDVFRYSMGPHFSPALYTPGADMKGAISPAFALGFTTYPLPPYYLSQDGLASLNTSL